jgi:hypothetical protein
MAVTELSGKSSSLVQISIKYLAVSTGVQNALNAVKKIRLNGLTHFNAQNIARARREKKWRWGGTLGLRINKLIGDRPLPIKARQPLES